MSADQINAIGCGPLGAVFSAMIAASIFHWQVKRWSRWMPTHFGRKNKQQLLIEYKNMNRIAKGFGLAGLLAAWLSYTIHLISDNDWRGLGVGVGLMGSLPVVYIVVANLMHGTEKVKEAWIAFVIDQKTPPKVLFAFIAVFFVTGVVSALSLLSRP